MNLHDIIKEKIRNEVLRMLKEKLKGLVAGVVLSSLVVGAVPTMAEKVTKTAELFYNNIKIVIDGKQADLRDAQGNTVEPFIIDGTTYLPVRAVSDALQKAVSWDGATQTVFLGKNDAIEQPSVWLKDLETFTGNATTNSADTIEFGGSEYNDILTANTGEVFQNYWYTNSDGASYLLNCKYQSFKGTFYLGKGNKNHSYKNRIVVYGDDKVIYTSEGVAAGSFTIPFDIDVSNVVVLKIVPQEYSEGNDSWYEHSSYSKFMIGNAGLYE